jgi:hypothetical protein
VLDPVEGALEPPEDEVLLGALAAGAEAGTETLVEPLSDEAALLSPPDFSP